MSWDSNRNYHWEKRRDAIADALDTFHLREQGSKTRERVERLVEDLNRFYLKLLESREAR